MEEQEPQIDVTVVFPCLNEELTLGACIQAAQRAFTEAGLSGEVIVADNGSSDRSAEIASGQGARVVPVIQPGYGNALREGLSRARGRYLVFLDADMSYDSADIPRFVQRLQAGADVVIGSRFRGGIDPGAMPRLHRYVGTPLLTLTANILFGCRITDLNCGMRALTRESFERLDLHSEGMEFASEMMIKAAQARLRIDEIPIRFRADQRDRHPHLRPVRDGWRHLQIMLHFCSLWVYMIPGLALVFLGVYAILAAPSDVHSRRAWAVCLLALLATMLGTQVLLLGFTAQGRVKSSKHWGRRHRLSYRLLATFIKIEKGLLLGLLMMLAGAAMAFLAAMYFHGSHDPAGESFFKALALSAVLSLNGLQLFTLCVFMALFGIRVADDGRQL